MIGLNAPADMRLAPQFFNLLAAKWIRVVLTTDVDLTPWIAEAHRLGMNVLGVIARESFPQDMEPTERWPMEQWLESIRSAATEQPQSVEQLPYLATCQFYADRYGDSLEAVQAGNESDHVSPSSWSLTPDELNQLLSAVNTAFGPDMTVVGPGMVSGDPHYLDAVDLDLVDAIAVHPYGQRPDNVQDWSETPGNFGAVANLLDSYRYHKKDIWVTEVGVSTTECSREFQARYCEAMLKSLELRTDVPLTCWFCADDAMVPEFGLFGLNKFPKPAATAFTKVAKAVVPADEPYFQLGFAKWAALEGNLLGKPLKNERNTGFHGWQIQPTSTGVLQWHEGDGHIFVTHDGRVFRWEESWPRSEEVAA